MMYGQGAGLRRFPMVLYLYGPVEHLELNCVGTLPSLGVFGHLLEAQLSLSAAFLV